MKERPILFGGPMVRAILDGRKTVTRRVIKPQPFIDGCGNFCWNGSNYGQNENGPRSSALASPIPCSKTKRVACPYGQPGDRLWVREAWSIEMLAAHSTDDGYDSMYSLRYRADEAEREIHVAPGEPDPYIALYDSQRGDWRPSIHMPRWASRILLEMTAVRVERLRDGDGETAFESRYVAEGINRIHHGDGDYYYSAFRDEPHPQDWCDPFDAWRELWVSVNGADSWSANPWVWVVEFRRIEVSNG